MARARRKRVLFLSLSLSLDDGGRNERLRRRAACKSPSSDEFGKSERERESERANFAPANLQLVAIVKQSVLSRGGVSVAQWCKVFRGCKWEVESSRRL